MSLHQRTEFPRIAQNPSMMRIENLAKVFEDGFNVGEINSVVSSILESPIVPDEDAHDLMWAEGYIHPDPLRQNFPSDFWDLEDGEVLDVYLIENLESNPEIYKGEFKVREELPEGTNPDFEFYEGAEFNAGPRELYENGSVIISAYPEDMDIGNPLSHNFRVVERPERNSYENVQEKLTQIFDKVDYQSTKAIRGLNMDYDSFKQGRLFSNLED